MQNKHLLIMASLAITGAILAPAAQAATTTYANDDLFLGFRKEGETSVYLVNIGQASLYRDLAPTSSFTLSIGNIGLDLNTIYPGWQNDPLVHWGMIGTPGAAAAGGDGASVLYAGKPQSPFGTFATPYNRAIQTIQNNVVSQILTMKNQYLGRNSTANSDVALIEQTSEGNDWGDFNPGSQSFSYFNGFEGDFSGGVNGSALDLFRMAPASGAGTYEGTFTINSSGAVTFTNVVPEPSSAVLIGLGASLLGFLRRRQQFATA
jgi:hypothetical protein